mmetsp:Transcript_22966/g.76134  ORF Transcript_22966/g.76134 Transcript_22966/m.76134 type:complete len:212 (-) Transcript_22966:1802-2437(-)
MAAAVAAAVAPAALLDASRAGIDPPGVTVSRGALIVISARPAVRIGGLTLINASRVANLVRAAIWVVVTAAVAAGLTPLPVRQAAGAGIDAGRIAVTARALIVVVAVRAVPRGRLARVQTVCVANQTGTAVVVPTSGAAGALRQAARALVDPPGVAVPARALIAIVAVAPVRLRADALVNARLLADHARAAIVVSLAVAALPLARDALIYS